MSTDFTAPVECQAYAALEPNGPIQPYTITRRAMRDDDVVIDIKYAGICHSDIHQVREEWGKAIFPMVPGHEIGGIVVAVGANVKDMSIGEHAGVGCFVDSCRNCRNCRKGMEQYCTSGYVGTYNSKYKYCVECGNNTYGGYSKLIVVDRAFALKIPHSLDLAAATPLLCAGITVYSPMMHFGLASNMKFGVVGLGGLGHMAVKFGVALGCHTTVISRGMGKRDNSLNELKAHDYIDSTDREQMTNNSSTFDFIICTISAPYDLRTYLKLLRTDGKFIVVGAPPSPVELSCSQVIGSRTLVAGSLVGGLNETQEMLDFCGRHNITCDIELIGAQDIDKSYDRTVASDVKYRFVIDTATF